MLLFLFRKFLLLHSDMLRVCMLAAVVWFSAFICQIHELNTSICVCAAWYAQCTCEDTNSRLILFHSVQYGLIKWNSNDRRPCLVYFIRQCLRFIYADSFLAASCCPNFNRQTNKRVCVFSPACSSLFLLFHLWHRKYKTQTYKSQSHKHINWNDRKDMHILMQIFNSRHIFFCHHHRVAFSLVPIHSDRCSCSLSASISVFFFFFLFMPR